MIEVIAMKTKEELENIKTEFLSLSKKLGELSEGELKEVFGGYEEQPAPTKKSGLSWGLWNNGNYIPIIGSDKQ